LGELAKFAGAYGYRVVGVVFGERGERQEQAELAVFELGRPVAQALQHGLLALRRGF